MDKNQKLPGQVLKLLSDNSITPDSIIAVSASDMNTECEYADGYVVLTASRLAVITSPADAAEVHSYKGYISKNTISEKPKDWAIRLYDTEKIERLVCEPLVACSLLVAVMKDVSLRLTAFSNLHRESMHRLTRSFDRLKNPEQDKIFIPDEEDNDFCPICGMMYPNKNRKICPKCMDRKSVFVRTLGYFKPYAGYIAVMLFCYIAMALMNLVWPYLNGTVLYDYVLAKNPEFLARLGIEDGRYVTALIVVVGGMLVARLVLLGFQMLQGVLTARIVTGVVRDIKKSIFANMGKLSISFFRSRQTGSLMTRALSDAERVTGFFIDGMPYIFINGMLTIATIVVMFTIKWQMALIAIVMIPAAILIGYYLRPRLWSMYGHRHRSERSVNSQVNDNLTGARVVKAFGQEKREIDRFRHNNERLRDSEMAIVTFQNYFRLIYGGTFQILNILVWMVGVYFILVRNEMELGILITFTGYVGQLQGPINFFSHIFHWWADSMNSAQRIFEILDALPEVKESDDPLRLMNPKGHIKLKNVSFGYEINKPVLKDISLDIPAGTMLGIVGRSGAGKTTLVNLISRLYDVNEGEIMFDGVNIRDISFKDLRRNVAMVSQETYIFMGTVAENIAYADRSASREDIVKAAKLASAHEFIMKMPDGYDTMIGSSGRELSGGEKQRISIARAILANPKVLILDEATASVDTETERAIQQSIHYLVKGRTTISIAHRLSTLRDADFLVVIDHGEITERGTADELAALKGTYYKLMELQTKALAMRGIE
ncbi:MAG: ABC transporter ATP-binding protein [Lachnospiraceae bacterium]|nr:ABC transporter ATP-binding protein [Lachnospiraceae bacterium]